MTEPSDGRLVPLPSAAEEEGPYRVRITPRRTARFVSHHEALTFACQLFHDRDHAVILEKLAPNGCWLQLDQLM